VTIAEGLDVDALLAGLGSTSGEATVAELGVIWPGVTPDRLALALAAAAVRIDEHEAISVWIAIDEQLAAGVAREVAFETGAILVQARAPEIQGLSVGPGLEHLPLRALAADIAKHEPAGWLRVERQDRLVKAGHLGGFFARSTQGSMIVLNGGRQGDLWVAMTFAHELAHALDPELTEVASAGQEAFAIALGELLLEDRPTTVNECAPLIAAVLQETAALRTPASVRPTALEALLVAALDQAASARRADEARLQSASQ
jgi:hypothetical protein